MQFGHPVRLGTLKAHDDNRVLGELPGAERFFHRVLIVEHAHFRLDSAMLRRHGRDLHHRRPERARQTLQTARRLERIACGPQDLVVQALA